MNERQIAQRLVKIAKMLVSSTSGFMSDYKSSMYDHFLDPRSRVWSYADDEGERMPLVMTEIIARKWDGEDVIWFSSIISPEKQGTGIASHVLKQIAKMADKHGVTMYMSPKPFGTVPNKMNKSKLVSWYRRNGFEKSEGGLMMRSPQ